MRNFSRFAIVPLSLMVLTLSSCAAAAPANVGSPGAAGTLAPCPNSPNCVNSQAPADDATHAIAPLTYTGAAADAKARIRQIVESMPRTKIVADEDNYLRAEFTSQIFRFVDDVEFVFDDASQTVHFRSASRMGQGDMGANRKRMEEIRSQFTVAK